MHLFLYQIFVTMGDFTKTFLPDPKTVSAPFRIFFIYLKISIINNKFYSEQQCMSKKSICLSRKQSRLCKNGLRISIF